MLDRIYAKIMRWRNRLYDTDVFETHDLGARVISVGNITTGGTGKTPLVAYIANLLAIDAGTVCILTRGYGRANPRERVLVSDSIHILAEPRIAGDEPYELAQKLLGKAIVIADADRVSAAEWAKRRFEVTAFVLDDAFQHRRAGRDLDIVCIDATDPFGGGSMLPFGHLREPLEGLDRADVIVITRSDLIEGVDEIIETISRYNSKAAVFTASTRITSLSRLYGKEASPRRVFAFCGIGNPQSFTLDLVRTGTTLVGHRYFRDHHEYTEADIEAIERSAAALGADALVTTRKDAVKLAEMDFELPCYAAESEIVISGAGRFDALVTASL